MSSNVEREWFYYLKGRHILLYQLLSGSSSERITQSGVIRTREKELMYPNEDIADGLRIEYTALDEPFVSESLETTTAKISGTTIAFVDGGGGSDTITDTGNGFVTGGFESTDKIRIQGSSSNDGDYQLTGAVAGTLTMATGLLTAETAEERVTITQIPKEDSSPSETSHINLNKMLSLAVVDYLKAMIAEQAGQMDLKEYYMKEFYGKLGDNESNKRKISMSFPAGVYAVR